MTAVLLAACVGSAELGTSMGPGTSTGSGSSSGTTDGANSATGQDANPPDHCQPAEAGVAWRDDASVDLGEIAIEGELEVYAAEYPLPGPTEGLWSQWGQGIAVGDGRHFSAVGDHLGLDGNSWFFVYDPGDRSLTRFADVLSLVPHQNGAFGYGKVHAQMVVDECGSVWVPTYWGTRRDLAYENGYEGDRLFEIDPEAATIADHGPIAGERGMSALAIAADGRTIVASAVEGEPKIGVLTAYDIVTDTVVSQVDDPRQVGFRALGVDPAGRGILYSIGDGRLALVDPTTEEATDLDLEMPGDWLRAITLPGPDGTAYGVTTNRDVELMFSLSATGEVGELGDPGGYTTSLAMTPDGGRVFWLPDAHGNAWEDGATVLAMDNATGQITEVVSLTGPFQDELGLRPGGTYSIVYDDGKLILGVNASTLDDDSGWGTVVLVVIEGI
jgi:hypothetical protein